MPLPTNIVPGFKFPENSTTILGWLNREYFDTLSIYKHAWGIRAGLTANSGERYGDQSISMNDPVFLGTVQVDPLWPIPQ